MKLSKLDYVLIATGGVALIQAYRSAGAAPHEATLNLASGYAMSVVFYFLLVQFPESKRRSRIRQNAIRHYKQMREELIGILLHAARQGWTLDEREVLSDPVSFRQYFSEDASGSGKRWYDVLNGLDEYYVKQLAMQFTLFRDEIQYVISSVDVRDEELYQFLKRLSESIYLITQNGAEHDDVKQWGRFLWEILADWSAATGYAKEDVILKMLGRI